MAQLLSDLSQQLPLVGIDDAKFQDDCTDRFRRENIQRLRCSLHGNHAPSLP